jgi:hypothetical protein
MVFKFKGGLVIEKNNQKFSACFFENTNPKAESRIIISVPAFLPCHWLIFSFVLYMTCQSRLLEQFSESQAVLGTTYRVAGGFLNALKVDGNEKEGGSRRWQMIGIGLGLRRSRFVCLLILLSSSILCISVSAPMKQNE